MCYTTTSANQIERSESKTEIHPEIVHFYCSVGHCFYIRIYLRIWTGKQSFSFIYIHSYLYMLI